MWTAFGKYSVMADSETFRIYPKNKQGQTVPVTRINYKWFVRHESGTLVVFKRYLHQKRWYWSDSRVKGPCSEEHVLAEVSRMLFAGDRSKGGDLLMRNLTGRPIADLAA